MNSTQRTVAAAAAVLATGLVGVASADAASAATPAKTARITSLQQLRDGIASAVAIEKAAPAGIVGGHPTGLASSVALRAPACSALEA